MSEEKKFTFNFSLQAESLKSVKLNSYYTLPEEFVTIVDGLALIWTVSVYPNGVKFASVAEPSQGVALAIDLKNHLNFKSEAKIKPKLLATFSGILQNKDEEAEIQINPFDFLPRGVAKVLPNITLPMTGQIKGLLHLSLVPQNVTQFLAPSRLGNTMTGGLVPRIHNHQAYGADLVHEEWSDVSIKCSDGVIKSSRFILAASSPYYVAAFRNNATNGLETGKLDQEAFTVNVVTHFLRCICSGVISDFVLQLSSKDQMDLLRLADQVESSVSQDLVSEIKRALTLSFSKQSSHSADYVIDSLQFAHLHSLPLLRNLALAELSGRLAEIPPNRLPNKDGTDGALSLELWTELCQLNKGRLRVSLVRDVNTDQ